MGNILLAQVLCKERHCIIALARDLPAEELRDLADSEMKRLVGTKILYPYCGQCGSIWIEWTIEVAKTGLPDLETFAALQSDEEMREIIARARALVARAFEIKE